MTAIKYRGTMVETLSIREMRVRKESKEATQPEIDYLKYLDHIINYNPRADEGVVIPRKE